MRKVKRNKLLTVVDSEKPVIPEVDIVIDKNTAITEKAAKKKRFSPKTTLAWLKHHPKRTIISVLLILVLLFAVPFTRYQMLGLALKKPVSFKIVDTKSNKPITDATVNIRGQEAKTNNEGVATFSNVKVGEAKVFVSKKYYESSTFEILVGLKAPPDTEYKLTAKGRPVTVVIVNTITKKPVSDAGIKAGEISAKTDSAGKADLVVEPDSKEVSVEVSAAGYNTAKISIKPDGTTDEKANSFDITPSGKLYFLSKASGKIDVVKTNLDGTDRQTVLSGTGKEHDRETVLLASRDWKYLALLSRRDSDKAKLYLINTSDDKLTVMDEGNASFSLVGWSNHNFVWLVNRENPIFSNKHQAIKSFNAESDALKVLFETTASTPPGFEGVTSERVSSNGLFTIENDVLFIKTWEKESYYPTSLAGKKGGLYKVSASGGPVQAQQEFQYPASTAYLSIFGYLFEPREIYFQINGPDGEIKYYEYHDGKTETITDKESIDKFKDYYSAGGRSIITHLLSPSGNENLWSEPRDGKNKIFIGDKDGKNEKPIGSLTELQQYGWYTDNYLLFSKNSSELYIMGRDGGEPLKITDYHKPALVYTSYGGGYGGF